MSISERRQQNPFLGPNTKNIDAYKRTDINPVISPTADDVFVADPFAIVVPEHGGSDGRLYVFYEAFKYQDPNQTSCGRIKVSYSDDGETFHVGNDDLPVVDELPHYHSAYPQVFRVHDTFYMAVSGSKRDTKKNDVRIYKTTLANFPTGWALIGRPAALNTFGTSADFDQKGMADFTFFQANGQWCCIYGGTTGSLQKPGFAVSLAADIENMGRWYKQHRGDGWKSSDPRPGFGVPSTGLGRNMRPGGNIIPLEGVGFVCFMQANSSGLYDDGQSVIVGLFQKGAKPAEYYDTMSWNIDANTGNIIPYLSPSNQPGAWDNSSVHHLSFVRFKGKWIGVYDGRNSDEVTPNGVDGPWRIGIVELPDVMP